VKKTPWTTSTAFFSLKGGNNTKGLVEKKGGIKNNTDGLLKKKDLISILGA
jgi:hypothetical protein